jgi:AcrR family transcriptional regulator
MPGNFKKEDLRVVKTQKALLAAFGTLLERHRFSKITVYDICEEALVSRTAFYTHFNDKYDLLACWLEGLKKDLFCRFRTGTGEMEDVLHDFFRKNIRLLTHLLENVDGELLRLLMDFLSPDICLSAEEQESNQMSVQHAAMRSFLAGGLLNLILCQAKDWHIAKKHLREDISYIRALIGSVLEWDAKRNGRADDFGPSV